MTEIIIHYEGGKQVVVENPDKVLAITVNDGVAVWTPYRRDLEVDDS